MRHFRLTSITLCVLLSLLLAGLMAGAASAQTGCKDLGYSAYSYTTEVVDGNTVIHFTFYNLTPLGSTTVRIYAVDVQGVTPLKKPDSPVGWEAKGHYFWETTTNPPSDSGIDPGQSVTGFTYYVDGTDISNLAIRMHFKKLEDATAAWDCSKKINAEPCLTVEKTVKGNITTARPGDTLTYTYKICNCGPTAVISHVLEDITGQLGEDITEEFKTANILQNKVDPGDADELKAGDCVTLEHEFKVPDNFLGTDAEKDLVNCLTVDWSVNGVPQTPVKKCLTIEIQKEAEICITKKAITRDDNGKGRVGENVYFCYTITNCGDFPLTVTKIDDSNPDVKGLLKKFKDANGNSADLDPGDSVTFYSDVVKIPNPTTDDKVCNKVCVTAEVTGAPGAAPVEKVTACAEACIKILPTLCVSIEKTANKECVTVGGTIIYTYKVCNCTPATAGANSNITIASIIDKTISPNMSSIDITSLFKKANGNSLVLKPGKCVTFTRAYVVKSSDVGRLCNVATVTLKSEDPVSDEVCVNVFRPVISVVKIADVDVASVDDTITYTITVCNITNETVHVSGITDTLLGNLLDEFKQANMGSTELDPGQCVTFTVQYKVKISDRSPLKNCVTVHVKEFDSTPLPLVDGDEDCFDVTACATVQIESPEKKICFLPVTFTQMGWHDFCSDAPGVPGGMIYSKFPIAFAKYGFFGTTYTNRVIIGAPDNKLAPGQHSMTFEAKTSALSQLCRFLPQTGPCDKLYGNYMNQSQLKDKFGNLVNNVLAGEVLALTLNIGYNDVRLMPRSRGYDLEKFTITQGFFRGKTVGYVLNVANALLAGVAPCVYGLPSCSALVDVLQRINANYQFNGIGDFIDRGYLKPNVPLGQPAAPHFMAVPF